MRRGLLTPFVLAAGMAMTALPASAEPFKCPTSGGNFVFGQEANINTLDQMTSATISTRNIAMNIYKSLMTRDDNNNPILELAESMTEAPDRLSYTFKLRQGIRFHNGKPMTSADVMASFDRYAKVGNQRSTLDNVDKWEAPDANTFVIRMKKVQPTFIEALSSFSVPIVIIPAELRDTPSMQLTKPIGTGPFELVESVPGSFVKLKRYDGYKPNTTFDQRTGFGGYKQACLDTVTFRIVTEPGARVAGLKTGELQGSRTCRPSRCPTSRRTATSRSCRWQTGGSRSPTPIPPRRRPTTCWCARRSRRRWTWTRSWTPRRTATTG